MRPSVSTPLSGPRLVLLALLSCAIASISSFAPAPARAASDGNVAIVFLPGPQPGNTGPSMIKRLSYRDQLALGFISATQGAYRPPQVLLDMGAGARVALSLYDDELPAQIRLESRDRIGRITRWDEIVARADTVPADIEVGALATAVRAAGRSIAYLGLDRQLRNIEAIVAADSRGVVEPIEFGRRNVAGRVLASWRSNDVVIAELPSDARGYRALDRLLAQRRSGDSLLVVQKPPRQARRLLAIGAAGLGKGSALRSESTRRAGLVTATDIAPTVLARLGVSAPDDMQGQPITAPDDRTVKQISNLRGRITQVGPRRWKVTLGGLAIAIAIVVLAGLGRHERRLAAAGRAAFLAALWLPGVLLVTGGFSTSRLVESLLIGVSCALLALLSERFVAWPRTPLVPAVGTVGAHLVDLTFGSGLIARSLLGPNPILGARFYGIGNELEIALALIALFGIGAAVASSAERTRVWAFLLIGGGLTMLLSWGRLGADVGAVFTLGAGVACAAVASLDGTPARSRIAIALLAPAAALGLLAAIDIVSGGDSHFTRSILQAGGMHEIAQVFQHKLESSYGSLSRGVIPLLALAAIIVLVVGFFKRRSLLADVEGYSGLRAGIYGALAAVCVGALTNDSGPVILLIGTVYLALAVGYVSSRPGPDAGLGRASTR